MSSQSLCAPPSAATGVFQNFCKLPTELRLKIWNYNLSPTRLVPLQCGSGSSKSLSWTGCTSPAPIPANLHTCAESRSEALKHYGLGFGFARGPGQVFLDPERDILYFGPRDGYMAADSQFQTCMSMCDPEELAVVRRLAINDALFWVDESYRSMTAASLTVELLRRIKARMSGLEELIFIPRAEESPESANYVEPTMVYVRMARQIQTAINTLSQQTPGWTPPCWRILPVSAFQSVGAV
ncbi:Ff.00g083350.m01.CDS01 [Fusarium sp. VM40]|nr:Ff.00g083350.m01.CDS01 [Fusarium sp. VM40]